MHLSNLTSIGMVSISILFNALQSHGHQQVLRGGKLHIPDFLPSPEKLVGTNWQLKSISGTPALPEPQELFFETETTLSGYDGCNWFSATWDTASASADKYLDITGPKISIDVGGSTLRGCFLEGEVQEQQRMFMRALRQEAIAFSLSADEQELSLYLEVDGSKDVPIVLARIPNPVEPHEILIGTSWIATDIVYSINESGMNDLRPVLEDHPVTISFERNTFRGSTGTNKYGGDITMMPFEEGGVSLEFQVTNVEQTSISWPVGYDDPRMLQEFAWMDIIEASSDEIVTIPYTLFDERIGDSDEWTQVLILGHVRAPLARFVPLPDDMTLDEWGEPIKLGGQRLVGMTGEEAKAAIEAINPSLEVHIVPEGSFTDSVHIPTRVRIFVDKNGKVIREPRRG